MQRQVININIGNDEWFKVDAILVDDVPGLAIHPEVIWSPEIGNHTTSSQWSVTHLMSGKALWKALDTPETAMRVAKGFTSYDFVVEDPEITLDEAKEIVEEVLREPAKESQKRYVVRRSSDGYDIVDTKSDEIIATKRHRGVAANEASDMNLKAV